MLRTLCVGVYSLGYPKRKVKLMGYYKNLEIELQEIQDTELFQIVAWDREHKDKLTAKERWDILTDEVKLKRALVLWENSKNPPKPKPAGEHVAVQVRRRDLRAPKKSLMCPIGWSLIGVALLAGVTLTVVNI